MHCSRAKNWRDGFSDEICIGLWLWELVAAGPRAGRDGPGGVRRRGHRQPARALAVAHGRAPVVPLHHRPGRQDRPPAAGSRKRRRPRRPLRAIPAGSVDPEREEPPDATSHRARGEGPADLRVDGAGTAADRRGRGLQQCRLREVLALAPRVRGGPDHHGPDQPVQHLHRMADGPRCARAGPRIPTRSPSPSTRRSEPAATGRASTSGSD